MKRIIFALLVILIGSIPAFSKYSGGSGTAGAPYQIGSAADLLTLAAAKGDYGKYFVLTADIDLGSRTFAAAVIAADTDGSTDSFDGTVFTGTFDGQGHKITNLTINTDGAGNGFLGLFGYIDGGEIKNLGLENISIAGGNESKYLGGLVGWIDRGSNISNCYVTGTVTGGNAYYFGGLTGYNSGTISNCRSTCAVIGGNNSSSIGGLAGGNDGDITNCYATGNTTGGDDSYNIGGLAGWNGSGTIINCYSTGVVSGGVRSNALGGLAGWNDDDGTISKCYSTGAVNGGGTSYNIGGLAGYNSHSGISNCYSTGAVTGGYNSGALGGLVGWNNSSGNISKCYSTGAVAGGDASFNIGALVGSNTLSSINNCFFLIAGGPSNGNGTPLSDSQMKQQASFVDWDFVGETANGTDDIWSINEGTDYPKLVWLTGVGDAEGLILVTKCTITAGSKAGSDAISFSGTMNATADAFTGANVVVTIDSNDMASPLVKTFPFTGNFKNGKFKCSISNASFALDTKTTKFSFTAKNVSLKGLTCPLTVQIEIGDYNAAVEIGETIVNGVKPIPINFLMGIKNSMWVETKVKYNSNKPNADVLTAKGGFAVADQNVTMTNRVSEGLVVTLGAQTFTIPADKLKAGTGKFTCSNVLLSDGSIAAASFDFNKSSFTLTIKNADITGSGSFGVAFAGYSVTLP